MNPEEIFNLILNWPVEKRKVLKAIGDYYKEKEEQITVNGLISYYYKKDKNKEEKSLPSTQTVYDYVDELVEEKILTETPGEKRRGTVIKLTEKGNEIYGWLSNPKEISKTMGSREYEKIFAKDDDEFYKEGCEIIQNSKIIRCAAKTPILLLPSERHTDWRRKYYETLMDAIVNRRVQVKYLFSYFTTLEEIRDFYDGNHTQSEHYIRNLVPQLIKNENLDLRWVITDNFMSCLVGEDKALYLLKDPQTWKTIGVVKEFGEKVKIYQDYFDIIFLSGVKVSSFGMFIKKIIIEKYLFSWDNIPGNDNVRLIEFLKQNFGIDWVKKAKIEKIDDGRSIKVSTEKNFLLLRLNDEKTKVNLKIDDGRTDEFITKKDDDKLNIYVKRGIKEF